MSVRTNWVEDDYALLIGAATFMTPVATNDLAYEVALDLPTGWKISATGLHETGLHRYFAPDYDTLVDSPVYAGNPAVHQFEVDGIPHYLVNHGEDGVWDGPRSARDVERIVRRQREMWGALPYQNKYVFLNMITEGGGGLEHRNSVCMMTSRWTMRSRRAYVGWLSLVSHEFFHVWNVKRLRPVELGPFDYETENPTTSLWFAEGFTEYYAHLLLHRAGLTTREEYLAGSNGAAGHDGLSGAIRSLQTTPGRLAMSMQQASFDAWIKLYRPDENTQNTSISYYVKGAVLAWLLDARIRRATNDARSLDDLMRLAYSRYAGDRGFLPDEIRKTAEEVAGAPLGDFFRQGLETAEELDYSEALDWFGLRFRSEPPTGKAWLGAHTKNDFGRLVITRVPRGTPAYQSHLSVDDEIIAIDGFRVKADHLSHRLENYGPSDEILLLIARREKLMTISLRLGTEPGNSWRLEGNPDATAAQKLHVDRWLQ
jgi:predicted metalloprotease with PDZ domain